MNLFVRFPPNSLVVNTPASSIRAGLRGQRICSSKGVKHLVEANTNMIAIPSQYVLPASVRSSLFPAEADIPLIDLHGLNEPPACREMVVRSIGTACSEWGFFRIVNHGIEERLVREMMNVVKTFFELPWEEKAMHASDDVMCPFRYCTSLNTPSLHVPHWRDYLRRYGHPLHKAFHMCVAKEYLEEVWNLAHWLTGAVSESLGLERKYVEKSMGEIVAANYYPPCPQPEIMLGLAAHSDHGGLTIIMQNEVDGLQVRHNDGWDLVRHVPGTFVVKVGDYLEVWSNGIYKSAEHRAVVDGSRARISVGVGHGLELSSTMAPAAPLLARVNRPTTRE